MSFHGVGVDFLLKHVNYFLLLMIVLLCYFDSF